MTTKLRAIKTFAASALLAASFQASAGWQSETVIGGKLQTILYVPDTAPQLAGKRALMISMHGCGQTNDEFKQGANWPAQADAYGMVIALPQAAGEGTYGGLGCWNFHVGMNMSRTSSDAKYLLDMVDALIADSSLNIDPNQVYITGLSSGGGMAASIGCLAPDVFAGVGVNAGPGPGSNGVSLSSPDISVSQGVSNCNTLSNKNGANAQSHLYTQVHNSICGSSDGTVSPNWCHRVSDIMAATYDQDTSVSDCSGGDNPTSITGSGTATTWCDSEGPRSSKIIVNGMGHAWPAGPGSSGGGSYIDHSHVNYPEYITAFFFDNNRRVVTNQSPEVSGLTLSENAGSILVSGTATDSDGSVTNVAITIKNSSTGAVADSFNLGVDGTGYFTGSSSALADANYTVTATATDNESAEGSGSDTIWVGPIPPNTAPTVSNVNASVNGECVTVTGDIVDSEGNLATAQAVFDSSTTKTINVTSSNMSFSVEECGLSIGAHSVVVEANDGELTGSSSAVNFITEDLGKTGNVAAHMDAGRITYAAGYSWCYTEYGASTEFTMREQEASGGQCQWVDENYANCAGPVQTCSGGSTGGGSDTDGDGIADSSDNCPNNANADQADNDNDGIGNVCDSTPNGDPQTNCQDETTFNYYHKTAGRAYSNAVYAYFAEGSDEAMSGSTWGTTTLYSTDGGSVWHVGSCP